jgi:hypothetical protein
MASISVVIPTFNRASKVIQAIDSVLNQTLSADEVIVVDDGSTDGTGDLIESRYGSRIRFLRQSNQGPSAARNFGIEAARCSLIGFLDSDDRWLPTKLEQQLPLFVAPDIVLSYTNWREKRAGRPDRFTEIGMTVSTAGVIEQPVELLSRKEGSGIWTSTCVVRKDSLRRCGGFDERMRLCEDIRLWFRLAFEGKFAVVAAPLVERGEPGADNLCQIVDPMSNLAYARESARLRLELFWETYARIDDQPSQAATNVRDFIARSLLEQSICHVLAGEYSAARRKALEGLGFVSRMGQVLNMLGIAVAPSIVRQLYTWKLSGRGSQSPAAHPPV